MNNFCFFDLEVENHEWLGKLAFPKHPLNYIVAGGWAYDDSAVSHIYFNNAEEAALWDVDAILSRTKVLVAHNATFELHWLLEKHNDALMTFLKRGGRFYCTQYAQYLISMQVEQYPTLEDTAVRYGGSKKIDQVKLLWDAGLPTSQIDKDLLIQYLADENLGDIANTRIAFKGTYKILNERGMLPMFWERMDSLIFNAICTWYGLHVNREVAMANLAANVQELDKLEDYLLELLPDDMPIEAKEAFNVGSRFNLSALLYGGAVKYRKRVSYDPIKFEKDDFYKHEDGTLSRLSDNIGALEWDRLLEVHGGLVTYKSGKNKGIPKVFREDTTTEKLKWEEDYYVLKGLIDFDTIAKDVADQFIGKRAEYKGAQVQADGTPVYSTADDALSLIANFSDAAKPVAKLAAITKDIGTYYIKTAYNADGTVKKVSGALSMLDDDDIINHSLNNTSTITGRLSAKSPNMQNIPRDGTSKVKEHFDSRFEGGRIVEVDYTALEVVTGAAITNDKALLENLLAGTDMHTLRLSTKLNRTYAELMEILHDKNHPEHKYVKAERTNIKPPSFAAQYGASPKGIAFATGVSIEFAEWFVANEEKLFPDFIGYRSVVRKEVERTGELEPMKREMFDDGSYGLYRQGYFEAKGGTRYTFRQRMQWRDGQQVMDYKDTEIANYWCQGEASFIVQVACGRVMRWLVQNDFFGGNVLPINTVHDAIYLDCASEEWARYAGKKVAELMASTPSYMCSKMPAYKEWHYDSIPFPAAAEMGVNMMDKVEIV